MTGSSPSWQAVSRVRRAGLLTAKAFFGNRAFSAAKAAGVAGYQPARRTMG